MTKSSLPSGILLNGAPPIISIDLICAQSSLMQWLCINFSSRVFQATSGFLYHHDVVTLVQLVRDFRISGAVDACRCAVPLMWIISASPFTNLWRRASLSRHFLCSTISSVGCPSFATPGTVFICDVIIQSKMSQHRKHPSLLRHLVAQLSISIRYIRVKNRIRTGKNYAQWQSVSTQNNFQ